MIELKWAEEQDGIVTLSAEESVGFAKESAVDEKAVVVQFEQRYGVGRSPKAMHWDHQGVAIFHL